jgi:hypothetical protein
MANLRIIHRNELAQNLTLTASTTAGTLAAANLLTDIKSQVWRSTATSAQLTVTWSNLRTIKAVILAHTNLTNAATMRVRGYTLTTDTPGVATAVFDTTALTCCAVTSATAMGWDLNVPGVANFSYGGGVYAGLFFTGGSVRKLYIELVDSGNAAGYVEAARLITGDYWEPTYNADFGLKLGYKDDSVHTRTDSGDLITDIKPRAKMLTFDYGDLIPADREVLMRILRSNGLPSPIFISVFPGDTDKNKEQDYQIYGKLDQLSDITLARFSSYTASVTVNEV